MKAAILTMFRSMPDSYSLVQVVKSHALMLLDAGIEVKIIVSDACSHEEVERSFPDPRIEWVRITQHPFPDALVWKDYLQEPPTEEQGIAECVAHIASQFEQQLADVCLCMLHDILYQGTLYLHNLAIRMVAAQRNDLRLIAFTHSYPANRPQVIPPHLAPRYTPLPNCAYVFPTRAGIPALAKQYSVPEGSCYVVHHAATILERMTNEVQSLARQIDLLSPDILMVCPSRLTPGKQLEKIVQVAGALKVVSGKNITVLYCDVPSTDIQVERYKRQIKTLGFQYSLNLTDMAFTSDFGFPNGLSNQSIADLFSLSNLFLCPSKSESFSLTLLEAAQHGNFLVVNEHVASLKEIGGKLSAYFMQWDARSMGQDILLASGASEPAYYAYHADQIWRRMKDNPVLKAKTVSRQNFSRQWIWNHQLKPLLEDLLLL